MEFFEPLLDASALFTASWGCERSYSSSSRLVTTLSLSASFLSCTFPLSPLELDAGKPDFDAPEGGGVPEGLPLAPLGPFMFFMYVSMSDLVMLPFPFVSIECKYPVNYIARAKTAKGYFLSCGIQVGIRNRSVSRMEALGSLVSRSLIYTNGSISCDFAVATKE
jgi:hypothetical protein